MILAASDHASLDLVRRSPDHVTIRISEYDTSSRTAEIELSTGQIDAIVNTIILMRQWPTTQEGTQPHADPV